MFFYLSFLRPPPSSASLSGTIKITPQVANDLRTEAYERDQDIYFSWSRATSDSNRFAPTITQPIKLTTWRKSSAYKELAVPLPPGIRDGQQWSLVLTVNAQGQPHIINLKGSQMGQTPLPVMSMPITFGTRSSTITKQEQIERVFRIPLKKGDIEENGFITITEQTSFDLDKKIWDSGIGLSSWLLDLYAYKTVPEEMNDVMSTMKDALFSSESCNIVELGAGTGIVALIIAALRSSTESTGMGGSIMTTDLPSAIPLLEHNIEKNGHLFCRAGLGSPLAAVLDWDNLDIPDPVASHVQSGINAIVMADVTYNTSSFSALLRTISSLARFNEGRHRIQGSRIRNVDSPVILLGYKERDPDERKLWAMARDAGIIFDRIGSRAGSGGADVEVWVGRALEATQRLQDAVPLSNLDGYRHPVRRFEARCSNITYQGSTQ